MSNFKCGKCGAMCYDTPTGYITGCEHYPPDCRQPDDDARRKLRGIGFRSDTSEPYGFPGNTVSGDEIDD